MDHIEAGECGFGTNELQRFSLADYEFHTQAHSLADFLGASGHGILGQNMAGSGYESISDIAIASCNMSLGLSPFHTGPPDISSVFGFGSVSGSAVQPSPSSGLHSSTVYSSMRNLLRTASPSPFSFHGYTTSNNETINGSLSPASGTKTFQCFRPFNGCLQNSPLSNSSSSSFQLPVHGGNVASSVYLPISDGHQEMPVSSCSTTSGLSSSEAQLMSVSADTSAVNVGSFLNMSLSPSNGTVSVPCTSDAAAHRFLRKLSSDDNRELEASSHQTAEGRTRKRCLDARGRKAAAFSPDNKAGAKLKMEKYSPRTKCSSGSLALMPLTSISVSCIDQPPQQAGSDRMSTSPRANDDSSNAADRTGYSSVLDPQKASPKMMLASSPNCLAGFSEAKMVPLDSIVDDCSGTGDDNFQLSDVTFLNVDSMIHVEDRQCVVVDGTKRWMCLQCPKMYSTKHNLITHMLGHRGIKPHSCTTCGKHFKQISHLQTHELTHSSVKPHVCQVCHRGFTQASHVKRHMAIHMTERAHVCTQCKCRFTCSSELQSHQKKMHPQDCDGNTDSVSRAYDGAFTGNGRVPHHQMMTSHACNGHLNSDATSAVNQPSLACNICTKVFTYPSQLRDHAMKHEGRRPFICTECGMDFMKDHHLKAHQFTHTGLKPFECHICGRAFNQKANLQRHLLVHDGNKKFSCEVCGRAFTQMQVLRAHLVTHQEKKPYQCKVCGKGFSRLHNLNGHLHIHDGEKPFVCTCGASFTLRGNLNRHRKDKHGHNDEVVNLQPLDESDMKIFADAIDACEPVAKKKKRKSMPPRKTVMSMQNYEGIDPGEDVDEEVDAAWKHRKDEDGNDDDEYDEESNQCLDGSNRAKTDVSDECGDPINSGQLSENRLVLSPVLMHSQNDADGQTLAKLTNIHNSSGDVSQLLGVSDLITLSPLAPSVSDSKQWSITNSVVEAKVDLSANAAEHMISGTLRPFGDDGQCSLLPSCGKEPILIQPSYDAFCEQHCLVGQRTFGVSSQQLILNSTSIVTTAFRNFSEESSVILSSQNVEHHSSATNPTFANGPKSERNDNLPEPLTCVENAHHDLNCGSDYAFTELQCTQPAPPDGCAVAERVKCDADFISRATVSSASTDADVVERPPSASQCCADIPAECPALQLANDVINREPREACLSKLSSVDSNSGHVLTSPHLDDCETRNFTTSPDTLPVSAAEWLNDCNECAPEVIGSQASLLMTDVVMSAGQQACQSVSAAPRSARLGKAATLAVLFGSCSEPDGVNGS